MEFLARILFVGIVAALLCCSVINCDTFLLWQDFIIVIVIVIVIVIAFLSSVIRFFCGRA